MDEARKKQAREEAISELLANLAVALLCGAAGAALFGCLYWRGARGGGGAAIAAALGFVLGSSYGLWHAISGGKRNDAQRVADDELKLL